MSVNTVETAPAKAVTLTPLQESIAKWQAIVDGTGWDGGSDNCALCREYFDDNCEGCPVAEATGDTHCYDSPYDAWRDLEPPDVEVKTEAGSSERFSRPLSEKAFAAARGELEFLKALHEGKV